jgi:hypothetical protein
MITSLHTHLAKISDQRHSLHPPWVLYLKCPSPCKLNDILCIHQSPSTSLRSGLDGLDSLPSLHLISLSRTSPALTRPTCLPMTPTDTPSAFPIWRWRLPPPTNAAVSRTLAMLCLHGHDTFTAGSVNRPYPIARRAVPPPPSPPSQRHRC